MQTATDTDVHCTIFFDKGGTVIRDFASLNDARRWVMTQIHMVDGWHHDWSRAARSKVYAGTYTTLTVFNRNFRAVRTVTIVAR